VGIDPDLRFAARYPFTKAAKGIVTGKKITVDWELMERAKRRVISGIQREDVPTVETNDPRFLEAEVLSYPIARMIVSFVGRRFAIRYINGEVRRVLRYVRESDADAARLMKEFGITTKGYNVDVLSYLKYAPMAKEMALVNQPLSKGMITLNDTTLLSLIGEASKRAISAGVPVKEEGIPQELREDIKTAVVEVKERCGQVVEYMEQPRPTGEIAPCMKRIIERLQSGEKVPHYARWAIATYMIKRGANDDELVALFSNTPNFEEEKTKYQIAFIRKKGYIPTCEILDSYGLCITKCGVKSPLSFGRRRRYGRK
jgi:DNA primase large subunit